MQRHSTFTVNNQLTTRHAGLIIGCGHNHSTSIPHSNHHHLHAANQFYTLDLSENIAPDLVGDISNPLVLQYLNQRKFSLVCVECIPALFFGNKDLDVLMKNLFGLLDNDGVFIILSSGNLLDNNDVYQPLLAEVETFKIYSLYYKDSQHHFPTCTIVAAKQAELNEFQDRYLDLALRDKNFCNGEKTILESRVVTRQPDEENVLGQRPSVRTG